MFVTGPPEQPGGGGLHLRRTDRRIFGGASELATDPSMRPYLTDMVGPYGLALREDVFDAAAGHSYGEMAEPLIEAVVGADEPVDVLVMAYDVHDVRLGRCTTTYLSGRCPGDPLGFAVCDQGVAGPFTALRAIQAYAVTGACRRALLLVVEQSALHYELASPARLPDRHAGVALLFEHQPAAAPLTVRHRTVEQRDNAHQALLAQLPDRDQVSVPTTLVLGPDLAAGWTGHPAVDEVVAAPAGQPCTGVWWELSARLPHWREHGRRVVLAEYDPTLRQLCTAVVRVPSGSEPTAVPAGAAAQTRAGA